MGESLDFESIVLRTVTWYLGKGNIEHDIELFPPTSINNNRGVGVYSSIVNELHEGECNNDDC